MSPVTETADQAEHDMVEVAHAGVIQLLIIIREPDTTLLRT
jgi:hypothetical protein